MDHELIESSAAPKPRKPLWQRILKWTIRVVVALVVLLAVGWGVFSYVASRSLEAEIEKLRAAGEPVTFAEWEKSLPKVPEADDAAPFYRAALALRRRSSDDRVYDLMDWVKAASTQPAAGTDPSATEIERVLADNALALEMVDRGSARPQCAYDFGLTHGIGAVLPQLSSARSLTRLLCLRTLWLVRQGKGREAADSLVASLRLMRMFDRQPVLVAYLVKTACTALCVDAVPAVLESGPLSDKELAALESALEEGDSSGDLERVWTAERVYMLETFRTLTNLPRASPDDRRALPEAAPRSIWSGPIFRMMAAHELRLEGEYLAALRKGWPDSLDAVREIARREYGTWKIFYAIKLPAYERATVLCGRATGSLRSAQVAAMVERYRLAKKHLPASLEELRGFVGHDLPADPFTGKDLIYKVQPDGFLVYSVGEGKTDDGGLLGRQQHERGDWGIAVRRAP